MKAAGRRGTSDPAWTERLPDRRAGGPQAGATINVTPVNAALVEGDETVILTLAANANYVIGAPDSATVTIVSDD